MAGLALKMRPSGEHWKMPSAAFSTIPRYFSSACRRASSDLRRSVISRTTMTAMGPSLPWAMRKVISTGGRGTAISPGRVNVVSTRPAAKSPLKSPWSRAAASVGNSSENPRPRSSSRCVRNMVPAAPAASVMQPVRPSTRKMASPVWSSSERNRSSSSSRRRSSGK